MSSAVCQGSVFRPGLWPFWACWLSDAPIAGDVSIGTPCCTSGRPAVSSMSLRSSVSTVERCENSANCCVNHRYSRIAGTDAGRHHPPSEGAFPRSNRHLDKKTTLVRNFLSKPSPIIDPKNDGVLGIRRPCRRRGSRARSPVRMCTQAVRRGTGSYDECQPPGDRLHRR
jgi:hypothetical protein